jgi:hypothetical protein
MSEFYGIMTILGPILLGAALLWATINNRQTRRQRQATEDATRRMYAEQERDDKAAERNGTG